MNGLGFFLFQKLNRRHENFLSRQHLLEPAETTLLEEYFSLQKKDQMAYISSDESCDECERGTKRARELPWESGTFRGLKRNLDAEDESVVKDRRRVKRVMTVRTGCLSSRPIPNVELDWAVLN